MKFVVVLLLQLIAAFIPTWSFVVRPLPKVSFHSKLTEASSSSSSLLSLLTNDDTFEETLDRELDYKPGGANTEFARRFGPSRGEPIRTVGEAFTDFTNILGSPVNALYKNMVTDIVGTTHLIVVNARFQRDGIWSLGIIAAMDLLLKNYPEPDIGTKIVSALFQCIDISEDDVRAEANIISDWAAGKSREDVAAAFRGEGDSPVADIAKKVKADEFWMYSRFFGLGVIKMMEIIGIEQSADETYPVMEEWVGTCLGKPFYTACSDGDTYFKIKGKLDMMETLMKEIEIREKKRMAQRLEEKAEAALAKAERDQQMQAEIESEKQD